MDAEELTRAYPTLYHMTEIGAWAKIRRLGLLSTTALLDLFEYPHGPERERIESDHRPEAVTIKHVVHGDAVIRDQKPLNPTKLARCLVGMSCREWYQLLNAKVFFWVTKRRVEELSRAAAYRARLHEVIVLDTRRLLERHLARVRLSAINTGATLYNPPIRGPSTFHTVNDFPWESRRQRRQSAIAELAVDHGVPDVGELVVRVECLRDGIWNVTTREDSGAPADGSEANVST